MQSNCLFSCNNYKSIKISFFKVGRRAEFTNATAISNSNATRVNAYIENSKLSWNLDLLIPMEKLIYHFRLYEKTDFASQSEYRLCLNITLDICKFYNHEINNPMFTIMYNMMLKIKDSNLILSCPIAAVSNNG